MKPAVWSQSNRLRLPRRSPWRGLALAPVSATLACATIGLLKLALPQDLWGQTAAQNLTGASDAAVFFAAIFFAPLYETFVAQLLPIEILRRCRAGAAVCIIVSAALFSLGHVLTGAGIAHGTTTLVAGLVFAYAYVSARTDGVGAGYVCAVVAHAGHNALLLYVLGPFTQP